MKWEEHLKTAWECAWDVGGLVFWAQLRDCGITATDWAQVVKKADLKKRSRGVYVLEERRDRVSVLKQAVAILPRAVVSHQAAALVHGFDGFVSEVPVVTVHSSTTHVLEGVVVRRNTDLKASHVQHHGGFAVTTRLRTIVDLSYEVGYERTAKLFDKGIAEGWFVFADVVAMWREVGRRGKPGSANIRRYVNERSFNPRAIVKSAVRAALRDVGVPMGRLRVEVPWKAGHFFDLASEEDRLGVHFTKGHSHGRQTDDRQTAEIEVAGEYGWILVFLSDTDLALRLAGSVSKIKALLAAREPA